MSALTLEVTKSTQGHYEVPLADRKLLTVDEVIREVAKVSAGEEVTVTLHFKPLASIVDNMNESMRKVGRILAENYDTFDPTNVRMVMLPPPVPSRSVVLDDLAPRPRARWFKLLWLRLG